MQNIIAIITAIITYIASLFSAIPDFVENIKAKPDFSWIIQISQTTEKSYEDIMTSISSIMTITEITALRQRI